jgi:hypothetical protein
MKTSQLIPLAAAGLLAVTGCDRHSSDVSKKIAELEEKNNQAAERQKQLEQELQDQKLASERDAIERERAKIDDDRADLEREQGDAAAAKEAAIRKREEDLSHREGKLEQFQSALAEKQDDLDEKSMKLSDRDRDLAGREALPFQQTEQRDPVGDYGMFYNSLSSYGSWFETADYGYVWQPVAVRDSNWRPYARGRWVCSDRGWNWVSEEPFGWATYHYGRWALLRGRGWIWVPGSDWAPCWVSWRQNDRHVGWAPLPPETLAYRGHAWDSSVDSQFGISASWYNFVDVGNFGGSLYDHCLPASQNVTIINQTTNITYIHIEKNQVICGGPKYREICDRARKQLPFYRLEIDQRSQGGRDQQGMRPRIQGDRMVISAPNINADWNDGLKPGRVKGRMDDVAVDRDKGLSPEITNHFKESRDDGRRKAEETIGKLGGPEKFDRNRQEQLQENRREADPAARKDEPRETAGTPNRPQRQIPVNPLPEKTDRPNVPDRRDDRVAEGPGRQPDRQDRTPQTRDDSRTPDNNKRPNVDLPPGMRPGTERSDPRVQGQVAPPPTDRNDETARENDRRQQQEQTRREQQRQADQSRDAQQDAINRRQQDQQKQQQDRQRDADQARVEKQQALEQQRAQNQQNQQQQENQRREQERVQRQQDAQQQQQQRDMQRQQDQARQRQQEGNQRQQEAQQQREMQRQQEQANQRQQEENQRQQEQSRQRQQEENQRQQEQSRQRQQQEENQRQQEQARQRQQDDARQKQEKDQDDQRRRNR